MALGEWKYIDVWDLATMRQARTITARDWEVTTVELSADCKKLATVNGAGDSTVTVWDLVTGKSNVLRGHRDIVSAVAFSDDGKFLASASFDSTVKLWDLATFQEVRSYKYFPYPDSIAFSEDNKSLAVRHRGLAKMYDVSSGAELKPVTKWAQDDLVEVIHTSNNRSIRADEEENKIVLRDVETEDEIATLISLDDNDWAVVDPDGRWDASAGAQSLMYYTLATPQGYEIIEFAQLRARYYQPDLLPKLLGYKKEPLRNVSQFKDVLLPPLVEPVETNDPRSTIQHVKLKNRNGGIGRVQVIVDGQEVIEDARDEKLKANPQLSEYLLTFDLKNASFIPGEVPDIKVVAWNYDEKAHEQYKGYVSSRGVNINYLPPAGKIEPPTLYAIIGGVSDYTGESIDLRFAAHDADSMYQAVEVGGKNLFGAERIKLKLLSTSGNPKAVAPTKQNFREAFEEFAREAQPNDVLLVYLSGHGITLTGGNNYYYLTQDAATNDKDTLSKDSTLLESSTISSEELIRWEKGVKAKKGLLILDTCAAGAIGSEFKILDKKEISSDAKRAIADMSNRIGFYVLMGSAADAVSYEAGQYGQGVLTYALLQGMRGPALKNDFVDVSSLFNYAADTVPVLARNIGGIQGPEIRVPTNSTSFPFGLFKTNADKSLIPYVSAKPQILRPNLQNQSKGYDDLRLTILLRDRFHEADRLAISSKAGPEQIFWENIDEMPGAIEPSGNYTLEGEVVKVRINLLIDEQPQTPPITLEGNRNDLAALIERIFQAIRIESQKLTAQRSETQK